jgi:hypothetical protein
MSKHGGGGRYNNLEFKGIKLKNDERKKQKKKMSIKKRKKIKKICMRKEKNIYEFIKIK